MANELIKKNYKDIANAIRSKTGENGLITAEEMPAKIESISTGIQPTGTKTITENAQQINISEFEFVDVNVPNPSTGTLSIVENGDGIDVTNYAAVDVNVPTGVFPSGSYTFRENVSNYDVSQLASVTVDVQPKGTITFTENTAVGAQIDIANYKYAVVNVKKFEHNEYDYIGYQLNTAEGTIDISAENIIRFAYDDAAEIPAVLTFQSGIVNSDASFTYSNWGESNASVETTLVLEGILPGDFTDLTPSFSENILQLLLTGWEGVMLDEYHQTALTVYNSLTGESYESFYDVEEPDESAVNTVGAACLDKWIAEACGDAEGSVTLTVNFVDQDDYLITTANFTIDNHHSGVNFAANTGGGS